MKSKNLFYLCIMFFVVVAIVFFGGYEYVKAQTNGTIEILDSGFSGPLTIYDLSWPSQIPQWPRTNINTSYAPTLAPLTFVTDLTRSMMITQTPSMDDMFLRLGMDIGMPMTTSPSFTMDYGPSMDDLQPGPLDAMEYNDSYGDAFMHAWEQTQWNPYSFPGRFAPARIRNTLYEFSTQVEVPELFPTPDKWRPSGGINPVPGGGGDWGGFMAYGIGGGGWTSMGGFGPPGGGWLGYGSIMGSFGYNQ
jgi:hypothetical protein